MEQKKKYTIYDIAEELNISVATVNRALHDKPRISQETKHRVLEMAEKMNFKVSQAAQSLRRKSIHIGIVMFCPVYQYLQDIKRGMDSAFEDLNKFNVYGEYVITDCSDDVKCYHETVKAIESFINSGANGLILFLSGDNRKYTDVINKAREKGVKVASVANEVCQAEEILSVYADGECAGSLAAEILDMCCIQKNIAILTGCLNTNIHRENIDGFKKYAKRCDFRSVSVYEHHDDPKLVVSITHKIIAEHPNTDGIYMTSASSPIACAEIEQAGFSRKMKIVTTDLDDDIRRLLSQKLIVATIFQDPYLQGKRVVDKLYQQIYEDCAPNKYLVIPQLIFYSNMNIYKM